MATTNLKIKIWLLIIFIILFIYILSRWDNYKKLSNMDVQFTTENFLDKVRIGDIQAVGFLLNRGMNPNIKDEFGKTVLMSASEKDYITIMRKLLGKGNLVNMVNN